MNITEYKPIMLPRKHGTQSRRKQRLEDLAAAMRCARIGQRRTRLMDEACRAAYAIRPCFVCERLGYCEHREPQVELALMGAPLGGER